MRKVSLIFAAIIYLNSANISDAETNFPIVNMICDRQKSNISQPCLCYVDIATKGNVTVTANGGRNVGNLKSFKCAMTFQEGGKLGNVMTQYATLYALAHMNNRPAFMTPNMAAILQRYFKVSIPAMSEEMFGQIKWESETISDWMQERFRHFDGQFVKVRNWRPTSFAVYDSFREEIRKEFTLHDEIKANAQNVLRKLRGNRRNVTFVGVHVRRGDYVPWVENGMKGSVGDEKFFGKAMNYFRHRYANPLFVVLSNGMDWCKRNIPNDKGDVIYAGDGNETDPIADFAILINCNHTIFTIGTYGHWAAYVTGGDVVYLANFTPPDSVYLKTFKTSNVFPSHWIPIAANLPKRSTTTTKSTLQSIDAPY